MREKKKPTLENTEGPGILKDKDQHWKYGQELIEMLQL